mgnify:CR=1 FL=1|jgi:hypothetical protein
MLRVYVLLLHGRLLVPNGSAHMPRIGVQSSMYGDTFTDAVGVLSCTCHELRPVSVVNPPPFDQMDATYHPPSGLYVPLIPEPPSSRATGFNPSHRFHNRNPPASRLGTTDSPLTPRLVTLVRKPRRFRQLTLYRSPQGCFVCGARLPASEVD